MSSFKQGVSYFCPQERIKWPLQFYLTPFNVNPSKSDIPQNQHHTTNLPHWESLYRTHIESPINKDREDIAGREDI